MPTTKRRRIRRTVQRLFNQYNVTHDECDTPLNDAIADAVLDLLVSAKKKASHRTKKKYKTRKKADPHPPTKKHTVKQLCDMPYSEYLETDHWKRIRKAALKEAGYECHLCNGNHRELHVHHLTYERRGRERPDNLMVLCAECHQKVHEEMSE